MIVNFILYNIIMNLFITNAIVTCTTKHAIQMLNFVHALPCWYIVCTFYAGHCTTSQFLH